MLALDTTSETAVADARVVLLVEDEALVRIFASDILAEAGFRTLEACSADEALTVLEAKPDIVALVTDVKMPGSLNGFGLAHLVASRWPEIGIVVVSAHALPGQGDMPKHTLFLPKPYQPSALIDAVQRVTAPDNVTPLRTASTAGERRQ
jgi:CheY-like chemotaxis protein